MLAAFVGTGAPFDRGSRKLPVVRINSTLGGLIHSEQRSWEESRAQETMSTTGSQDEAHEASVVKQGWLYKRGSKTNAVNTGKPIVSSRHDIDPHAFWVLPVVLLHVRDVEVFGSEEDPRVDVASRMKHTMAYAVPSLSHQHPTPYSTESHTDVHACTQTSTETPQTRIHRMYVHTDTFTRSHLRRVRNAVPLHAH